MKIRYKIATINNMNFFISNDIIDTSHLEYINFIEIRINGKMYDISENKYYFFFINKYSGELLMPYNNIINNSEYEIWWDEENSNINLCDGDELIFINNQNGVLKLKIIGVENSRKEAIIKKRKYIIDDILNDINKKRED